jgi:hypothetical protein
VHKWWRSTVNLFSSQWANVTCVRVLWRTTLVTWSVTLLSTTRSHTINLIFFPLHIRFQIHSHVAWNLSFYTLASFFWLVWATGKFQKSISSSQTKNPTYSSPKPPPTTHLRPIQPTSQPSPLTNELDGQMPTWATCHNSTFVHVWLDVLYHSPTAKTTPHNSSTARIAHFPAQPTHQWAKRTNAIVVRATLWLRQLTQACRGDPKYIRIGNTSE